MAPLKSVVVRLCLIVAVMLLLMPKGFGQSLADAGKQLADAERKMLSGKTDEANDLLKQVEAAVSGAKSGGNPVEAAKVKLLEGRVTKLRKSIDQKMGGGAATAAAAAGPKLPSEVEVMLKRFDGHMDRAEKNSDPVQTRNALEQAKTVLKDIEEKYQGRVPKDHPKMVAARERLAKAAGEASSKAATDAASASAVKPGDWLARLKPYVTGPGAQGYDKERYFAGGYTEEEQELATRARIYTEARADLTAFRKSSAAASPSDELAEVVKNLEYQLKTFVESCDTMARQYLDEAEAAVKRLDEGMKEQETKAKAGEKPLPRSQTAFDDIIGKTDKAARLLDKKNERLVALRKSIDDLLKRNGLLRKAMIAETRMGADKFKGSEADELKKKAESIVLAKNAGAKVLRTVITTDGWKEESVVEWTDTTQTALRHRVTRFVTAQVAVKKGGEVVMHTTHLAADRQSDGKWSALYGHIMYSDQMLEENVAK